MIYKTISTLLQKADPELAHSLAIKFLKNSYLPFNLLTNVPSSKLEINILGKNFFNIFNQSKEYNHCPEQFVNTLDFLDLALFFVLIL